MEICVKTIWQCFRLGSKSKLCSFSCICSKLYISMKYSRHLNLNRIIETNRTQRIPVMKWNKLFVCAAQQATCIHTIHAQPSRYRIRKKCHFQKWTGVFEKYQTNWRKWTVVHDARLFSFSSFFCRFALKAIKVSCSKPFSYVFSCCWCCSLWFHLILFCKSLMKFPVEMVYSKELPWSQQAYNQREISFLTQKHTHKYTHLENGKLTDMLTNSLSSLSSVYSLWSNAVNVIK